ncbi:MAG: AMP-binding protein, partial [Alphaproteobacteria bacterium]
MLPIDSLYRGCRINPDGIALEDAETRLTYRQTVAYVEALAAGYQAMLPGPQSKVATCGFNNLQHVLAILACHMSGNIWVSINPRSGRMENDALIAAVEPDLIVADAAALDQFDASGIPLMIAEPGPGDDPELSVDATIEGYLGTKPVRPLLDPDKHLQAIKFTGGSTGLPKAVMQPYRTGVTLIGNILSTFRFERDECQLAVAPVSHAAFTLMLPIFAVGGRNIVMRRPDTAAIVDAFVHQDVSAVFMPPTMIYKVMAEPGIEAKTFPKLRHLLYSAAPMPPEKVREARTIFPGAIETIYGQTEASSICTAMTSAEFDTAENIGSVGRATPLTRVEVMDPDGNILPPGEDGEVVVQGGLVMTGYYRNPQATAETIRDGWLHTGDIGAIDERGYLYLKDRMKDVIISGGFNVYPSDVEGALTRHPSVYECVVFGVGDDKWGERVEAAVVLRDGANAGADELTAFVREGLGSVKTPKAIHIVDDLPRSAVGKVLRRDVKAQWNTP